MVVVLSILLFFNLIDIQVFETLCKKIYQLLQADRIDVTNEVRRAGKIKKADGRAHEKKRKRERERERERKRKKERETHTHIHTHTHTHTKGEQM